VNSWRREEPGFFKKLLGSQHSGAPTPPQQMQKKRVKIIIIINK
jgi:hypothetical protein